MKTPLKVLLGYIALNIYWPLHFQMYLKIIFQDPKHFCRDLTMVILEIHKISVTEFKQIFMSLIETITNIIAKRIQEVSFFLYI